MSKWPRLIAVLAACLSFSGCGGTSARDLKNRYAQRKTASDKDDESSTAKPAPPIAAPPTSPIAPAVPAAAPPEPAAPQKADPGPEPKPKQSLSPIECRRQSIANLEKIGRALAAYSAKHGKLPPIAILDDEGRPMLSWRVAILPELGYPELYQKFRLSLPWYNVQNKKLLSEIPKEYQSPERSDTKTNYLGVAGDGMALAHLAGMPLKDLKDGADNTLAVVETDERFAQEWTQTVEFVPNAADPKDGLGLLRGDGTFGVMASGRLVIVPRTLPRDQWTALFTPAAGDRGDFAALLPAPSESPLTASATPVNPTPVPVSSSSAPSTQAASQTHPQATSPPQASVAVYPAASIVPSDPNKIPVPAPSSLASARKLLKEVYKSDYEQAQTREQRLGFAKKLLADVKKVDESPADYYELLRIARDIAASVGDVKSVIQAVDLLEQRFQIDSMETRLRALGELENHARVIDSTEQAQKEALRLMREAFGADRYEVAIPAQELVLSFKRIEAAKSKLTSSKSPATTQDRDMKVAISRAQRNVESLREAKNLFATVQQSLVSLKSDPVDGAANEVVGRYLCFVKNQWDAGLPFLARAADIKLRIVATIDATTSKTAAEALSLGDQYWEMAGTMKEPQKRGLRLRAAYCYSLANREAASSLGKIRATQRIAEVESDYGTEELEDSLGKLPITATETRDDS